MFAAIDIGTNSVLLLVAEVGAGGSVRSVEDCMTVTRLGEGLGRSGVISDAAAGRTLDCLRRCREICAKHGVRGIAAVGTAPLRGAANAAGFLSSARQALGIEVEVISAEREAALTFRSCARDFGGGIVVIDIGGGSTEVMARDADGTFRLASLPAGSVVLTEQFLRGDPPAEEDIAALRQHVHRLLEEKLDSALLARPHDRELIATAGTATTLAAMNMKLPEYDSARIHGSRLTIDVLRDLIDALRARPVAERKKMPGLAPERADVILAGAELLQELMSSLGYAGLTVSDRGLRWGLFEEKFCA